jgi:hypothetical protein
MRATDLLQRQLTTVNTILHAIGDDLSDEEWVCRVLPGTNLIAFDLWHVARTQDWAVQTLARGVHEVIADPRWVGRGALATRGIGVGMTLEQADDLAHHINRADVLAYADAVHSAVMEWLATLDDAGLESHPDVLAHYMVFPEYQTPEMRAETPWAFQQPPLWRCLMPAVGHVRDHLAECDLLKRQMRSR